MHLYPQATSVSSLRTAQCQFVRADQAEPVPWTIYHPSARICTAADQWSRIAWEGEADTLRLEAREHSSEEVGNQFGGDVHTLTQ